MLEVLVAGVVFVSAALGSLQLWGAAAAGSQLQQQRQQQRDGLDRDRLLLQQHWRSQLRPDAGQPGCVSGEALLAAAAGGAPLLFRQLFDAPTGTFTYLLADVATGEGVLIDPVFEQHERDLSLIRELGLRLVACLDTHAHADHVTGSWLMHQATGSAIGLAAVVRADHVNLPLEHGDRVRFGARALEVRSTPGHTDGCVSYVLDDQRMAFTGDAQIGRAHV